MSSFFLLLGLVAIVLASINMVGGFVVTDRMLEMVKPKKAEKAEVSKLSTLIALLNKHRQSLQLGFA